MQHGGVVNAAYFSPLTGRKIMTTCQVRELGCDDGGRCIVVADASEAVTSPRDPPGRQVWRSAVLPSPDIAS
jgi:hypothetical protein